MAESEFFDSFLLDSVDAVDLKITKKRIHSFVQPDPDVSEAERLRTIFRTSAFPYEHRLSPKEYLRQKYDLQVEIVKLQNWVKESGSKIVLLFEGRDAAGKGSTIRRFMEHMNPRGARVVALDKPTEFERGQWYFQRYVDHLPTRGEIVFFDRSWYNRAGVERVMGFCTDEEYHSFMAQAPLFEGMLAAASIQIFKFYLSISKHEQSLRFEERKNNPLKQWKLSPVDVEAQGRWDAYSDAKSVTMDLTDTSAVPWTLAAR